MEKDKNLEKNLDNINQKLDISYVITCSTSEMIEIIENKLKNTVYPTVFDRECDETDLRVLKLVLEMNKVSNVR